MIALEKFFGLPAALRDSLAIEVVVGIGFLLVITPLIAHALLRAGALTQERHEEIKRRWKSWLWLVAAIVSPVFLGAGWVMLAAAILSWVCYREFARATGLFEQKAISLIVLLGISGLVFSDICCSGTALWIESISCSRSAG